jgi:hypothetical protein
MLHTTLPSPIRAALCGILSLLALPAAQAATWADYEAAFPAFPCQDGWMACYQGGQRVEPTLLAGDRGIPLVANARIDFFTLAPTSAFSPFAGLSTYPMGGPPAAPEPVAVVEPVPEPMPVDPMPAPMPVEPSPSPTPAPVAMTQPSPSPAPSMVRPGPSPAPVPTPAPGGMVRPGSAPAPAPAPTPTPAPSGMVRPGSTPAPTPTPAPVAVVAPATQPSGMVRPGPAPAVVQPTPAPAPVEVGCDDLVRLEPTAMIGRLSDDQIGCLEAGFADAARQTDKKKISILLINNAKGKGDNQKYEQLIRRHLEEVDQSDPDMCYSYASFLARKGPSRAPGVIRWSEVALENKTRWSGETYTSRVNTLYKLRAAAANALWQQAAERHAAAPTDETSAEVERTRGQTKTYAREWYEYARSASLDTTLPLQLCTQAAGTAAFCEGS